MPPDPSPGDPVEDGHDVRSPEQRARNARTWVSTVALVILVVGAGLVIAHGFAFFGVVLVVLAVFAAVDLTWVLRRSMRSR
ncbi:MAG: hypothetical protein J0I34_04785 [Pseudonocardia sp.]|uniref:hypothetical protein n=1 Tax=unclassified Pseudonocardia TaxID=2619320 RepID=UPI00086F8FAA|nr:MULTISPECIES: hypothetical protein [unclassified Pseudonocardia]MBN9108077.1 hypothetical protein [Pseudonocardia sp.]ODU11281.1 MAG: hypothetical protein ABS80_22740 [Pseudonocardia sp. SCN 72-51]ODV04878.1 MAG: hypothetical protein ABT15_19445 [Pseudonocardia sp. SCN 73-27]